MTSVDNNLNGLELLSGKLVTLFLTLAMAEEAVKRFPAGTKVKVTNDPNPDLNGEYEWDGVKLVKTTNNTLEKAKEQAKDAIKEEMKDQLTTETILDLLEGALTGKELDRRLEQRIERIPSITGDVDALKDEVKVIQGEVNIKINNLTFDLLNLNNTIEEIENTVKDLQLEVDADFQAIRDLIDEKFVEVDDLRVDLNKEIQDRITAIKEETDIRVAEIKKLNDGLTQEIVDRKDGDKAVLAYVDNYKVSNETALANIREEVQVAVDTSKASAIKVDALDARVESAENNANTALENSATAVTKVNALATDVGAVSERVDSLTADVVKAVDDSGKALTNSATALTQSKTAVDKANAVSEQVNVVEAKLNDKSTTYRQDTAPTKADTPNLTKGDLWINPSKKNEQKRWDGTAWVDISDVRIGDNATAISKLSATVSEQGDTIQAQANKLTNLETSVGGKADASAVESLKVTVTKQGEDIKTNANSITALQTKVDGKADAKALSDLSTTVTQQGKDITSQGQAITSVTARLDNQVVGGTNKISDSAKEVSGEGKPSQLEYLLYRNSAELNQAYSEGQVTISFDIKVGVAGNVTVYGTALNPDWEIGNVSVNVPEANKYVRRHVIVTPKRTANNTGKSSLEFFGTYGTGRWIAVKNVKVENGNVPTAWSPAPSELASSEALSTLNATVKQQGDTITSQGTAITGLKQEVDGKASSQAVNELKSTVTKQGEDITAQGKEITSIKTSVAGKADTSALNALTATVTQQGKDITSQGQAITSLQTKVDGKADASALNSLKTTVEQQGNTITSQGSAITKVESNVNGLVQDNLVTPFKDAVGTGAKYLQVSLPLVSTQTAVLDDVWTVRGKISLEHDGVLTASQGIGIYLGGHVRFHNIPLFKQGNDQYFEGTVKVPQSSDKRPFSDLSFYFLSEGTAKATTKTTVHWAELRKGDQVYSIDTSQFAKASAVTALETKVNQQGDTISSQGQAITSLQNSVAGKADTSAVNQLKSTVDKQGQDIVAQGQAITKVDAKVSDLSQGITNLMSDSERERVASPREYMNVGTNAEFNSIYARGQITISFDISVSVAGNVQVYCTNNNPDYTFQTSVNVPEVNKYVRRSVTVTPTRTSNNTGKSSLEFYGIYDSGRFFKIKNIKIEAGGTATAWSPSPSDVASAQAVTALDAKVTTIGSKVDANASAITDIRTSLNGKADASALNSLKTTVEQQGATISSQGTAITSVSSKLTDVQNAGGDNLIWNGDASYPDAKYWTLNANVAGQTIDNYIEPSTSRKYIRYYSPASAVLYRGITQVVTLPRGLKRNTTYTISFKACRSSSATAFLGLLVHRVVTGGANEQLGTTFGELPQARSSPATYSYTFKTDTTKELEYLRLIFWLSGGSATNAPLDFYLSEVQLEEGNVATGFKASSQPIMEDTLANSTAISKLDTRTTATEGAIKTQATQITGLQSTVAGKADTSALNSLKTTVEQQGNAITSQGTALTQVEAKIGAGVGTRNFIKNSDLTLSRTNTGSTGGQLVGTVPATYFDGRPLMVSVYVKVKNIRTKNSSGYIRAGYETSWALSPTGVRYVGAWLDVNYIAIGGSFEGRISMPLGATTALASVTTPFVGGALHIQGFTADEIVVSQPMISVGSIAVDWNKAPEDAPDIDTSQFASASALNSLDTKVTGIDSKVNAQATSIQQLDTKVGNNTASIQTQAQSIDGVKANWTMRMDVNGYVSGIGAMNDGKTSEFIIRADKFAIANPTGTGKKYGFVYKSSPETLPNGTVIPAGLYVDNLIMGAVDAKNIKADNIRAISANLGTFESGVPNGQRTVISGSSVQVFDANNVERIFLGVR